jgi:hypothetical protein
MLMLLQIRKCNLVASTYPLDRTDRLLPLHQLLLLLADFEHGPCSVQCSVKRSTVLRPAPAG